MRVVVPPRAFREAVVKARRDPGLLGLLGEDAAGEPWESAGWRLVARRQVKLGLWQQARRTWERVRVGLPDDVEANAELATVLQRLAIEAEAQAAPDRVPPPPHAPLARPDTVVVFSGHMLDLPGRAVPRFPADKVLAVRAWIASTLARLAPDAATCVGVAGAARGGDLLFHEEARRLGIRTEVLLAVPAPVYRRLSVDGAGPEWGDLFDDIVPASPLVLQEREEDGPEWVSRAGWGLWSRNTWWTLHHALGLQARGTVLLALWDGREGDGRGGTRDMVEAAREMGVRLEVKDPSKL